MLTAPRITISRVCPMSDLVRLEPGCQAARLRLCVALTLTLERILVRGKPGLPSNKALIYYVRTLYVC